MLILTFQVSSVQFADSISDFILSICWLHSCYFVLPISGFYLFRFCPTNLLILSFQISSVQFADPISDFTPSICWFYSYYFVLSIFWFYLSDLVLPVCWFYLSRFRPSNLLILSLISSFQFADSIFTYFVLPICWFYLLRFCPSNLQILSFQILFVQFANLLGQTSSVLLADFNLSNLVLPICWFYPSTLAWATLKSHFATLSSHSHYCNLVRMTKEWKDYED